MANITIDGKPHAVKDGITIIEALDEAKIGIPRYCYHPGLSIAGNCRICQVEVEKMPRTVIACNTRVTEGMVIHTQSAKAKESQQVVLEFLLANHPLDCPVCDQAGECKLQDYYMEYGLYDPHFNETKVKKTKKAFPIGPTISLDQERCILCSRCVRFTDEVTKTHEFGIFNRGDRAQVDVHPGRALDNPYSGNVADICPVGALTDRDFRFKLRVWYLGSGDTVCPGCSRGCNIRLEYEKSRPYPLKDARVMRLKPRENPDVNRWWICDEGRYGYKAVDQDRIRRCRAADGPIQREVEPAEALRRAAEMLGAAKGRWAVLASPQSTNEELYLTRRLFRDHLKWKDLAWWTPGQEGREDDFLMKKDKNPNSTGARRILGLDERTGNAETLLERARRGEFEGLFIFNHDLDKEYGSAVLLAVRQHVRSIVYAGPNDNPTARAADLVLASASYAEKDGTFTNFEGRVQRIRRILEPLGQSRPDWSLLIDLGRPLGLETDASGPEAVLARLGREDEAFRDLTYKSIGPLGRKWGAR